MQEILKTESILIVLSSLKCFCYFRLKNSSALFESLLGNCQAEIVKVLLEERIGRSVGHAAGADGTMV